MDKDEKVAEIHKKIKEVRDLAKHHADEEIDPKCAALCETSYEVLAGLETAYDHFFQRSEKAWE